MGVLTTLASFWEDLGVVIISGLALSGIGAMVSLMWQNNKSLIKTNTTLGAMQKDIHKGQIGLRHMSRRLRIVETAKAVCRSDCFEQEAAEHGRAEWDDDEDDDDDDDDEDEKDGGEA